MRAVFESSVPFAMVGYHDVNGVKAVYGFYNKLKRAVVGSTVSLPDTVTARSKMYHFSEGAENNQLTLTEPIEILNMREWIRNRLQSEDVTLFTEVYSEGVPQDLENYVLTLQEEQPEEDPISSEEMKTDDFSEWDHTMLNRLMN